MKLVPKLTLALFTGSCVILAANAYLRVRREIASFEADRVSDHGMIGRSVVAAAGAVWKSDGRDSALATLDAVNSHFSRIQIRWLAPSEHGAGPVGPDALASSPSGVPLTRAPATLRASHTSTRSCRSTSMVSVREPSSCPSLRAWSGASFAASSATRRSPRARSPC